MAPPNPYSLDPHRLFVLFSKLQFDMSILRTDRAFIAALSLCPHEMKASAVMCSSVMPEKRKPAGHVHTILLVISGREVRFPSRVMEDRLSSQGLERVPTEIVKLRV